MVPTLAARGGGPLEMIRRSIDEAKEKRTRREELQLALWEGTSTETQRVGSVRQRTEVS